MIHRPDIHPDDTRARRALRTQFARLGEQAGITGGDLGRRLGVTRGSANNLLNTTSWAVRRVQAWARALDHQFRMTITGVAVPDTDDLMAELFAVATPANPAEADRLHLLGVVNDLMRIRDDLGVPYRVLGERAGVDDRALREWEGKPDGCLLKSVQRYTRALGGALALEVTPAGVLVPA